MPDTPSPSMKLTDKNTGLSRQLETAHQKVQEIAEKSVESPSQRKSLGELQNMVIEQSCQPSSEK